MSVDCVRPECRNRVDNRSSFNETHNEEKCVRFALH